MALARRRSCAWQRGCADFLVGRPRTGHRNRGLEKRMKKTISALVAVALLSFGVAFAQQATTTTQTEPTTRTTPAAGATIEKSSTTIEGATSTGTKTTTKKHKKVTKKSGATKSTTTKTEAETASTPDPAPGGQTALYPHRVRPQEGCSSSLEDIQAPAWMAQSAMVRDYRALEIG